MQILNFLDARFIHSLAMSDCWTSRIGLDILSRTFPDVILRCSLYFHVVNEFVTVHVYKCTSESNKFLELHDLLNSASHCTNYGHDLLLLT